MRKEGYQGAKGGTASGAEEGREERSRRRGGVHLGVEGRGGGARTPGVGAAPPRCSCRIVGRR